ncbi:hypothetical protein EBN03_14810 [Nocardia stercoris]|uniref:Zinc ribbon domain-containing protein n=1 Tax=Nocardia stercoris TaxID=2483361 RepID=A0A3M2L431_9NOCA|nr:hypothetical protein EBN03_14810 [Nocardia stercoris]
MGVTFSPSAQPPVEKAAPASESDDPNPGDRAMLHRTELTRTYPCANCGSQLAFDPASQKLRCPSCGNYAEISAPREQIVAHDLASAMAQLREWQAEDAGPQLTGDHEVKCQNCGGTTAFAGTLTATRCPYCATPIQRDDVYNAPARLPVDGVLPFRIDEKTGRSLVEKWVSGRWFAPSDFKKYKRLGSFASVYHAYFTYDAETSTWYTGEQGIEYTVQVGRDDDGDPIYETRVNWYPVSGQVDNEFADLPVLANTEIDRSRVKALEPWPIAEAISYSPEYLAGHLARTYDQDAEQAFPEARQQMESAIESTVRADIGGDQQRIHDLRSTWNQLAYKHVLLPIWLLTVVYGDKPFQVYINGLTGEVSGERPWSKVKLFFAILAAVLVIVAIIAIFVATRHPHTTPTHHYSPPPATHHR